MARVTYTGPAEGGIWRLGRHEFAKPVKPGQTVEVPDEVAAGLEGSRYWHPANAPTRKKKSTAKPATEETTT